jgi:hypothetical protein
MGMNRCDLRLVYAMDRRTSIHLHDNGITWTPALLLPKYQDRWQQYIYRMPEYRQMLI